MSKEIRKNNEINENNKDNKDKTSNANDSSKPLIGMTYADMAVRDEGMTVRTYCGRPYYAALQKAGARVILLPPVESQDEIRALLDLVDGLLLPGGEDIDPRFQNQDPSLHLGGINPFRDWYELETARMAFARRIPTLGICRGIQIMAIALGGSVHQDLSRMDGVVQHVQNSPRWAGTHRIRIDAESVLTSWMRATDTYVNSFHHQAVNHVPEGLRVVARSGDGLIEALESNDDRTFVGVQWHPEELATENDPVASGLFSGFVNAVKASGDAKKAHVITALE
ncbi:MAG: gamma-glutamyl-gamma-aminobutyrate hydrolase family protein [Candidatus Ozemobacteraceae bacterium]